MSNYSVNDYFNTFDLGLSAALVSLGFPIDHLDKSNARKVEFVFLRVDGLDQAIQSYWSNSLSVSALSYFNATKMIKNRIYSE